MSQQIKDYSYLEIRGSAEVFLEKRLENDGSGNPLYVGYNRKPNAATTEESWYIIKMTYSGGYVVRVQLPDNGPQFKYAWDSRASYFS